MIIGAYTAGTLLLIGGLGVVLLPWRRLAILAFVGCLLMVSALAWLLGAPVLAGIQLAAAVIAAAGLLGLPEFRAAGENGWSDLRRQVIPGAIAAAAVLGVMALLLLRGTWHPMEPGTGTSWHEYLAGGVTAGLVLLTTAAGILSLLPLSGRQPGPVQVPVTGRRKRDRR